MAIGRKVSARAARLRAVKSRAHGRTVQGYHTHHVYIKAAHPIIGPAHVGEQSSQRVRTYVRAAGRLDKMASETPSAIQGQPQVLQVRLDPYTDCTHDQAQIERWRPSGPFVEKQSLGFTGRYLEACLVDGTQCGSDCHLSSREGFPPVSPPS